MTTETIDRQKDKDTETESTTNPSVLPHSCTTKHAVSDPPDIYVWQNRYKQLWRSRVVDQNDSRLPGEGSKACRAEV